MEWPDSRPLHLLETAIVQSGNLKESVLAQRAYITLLTHFQGPESDKIARYQKVMHLTDDAQTQRMIFSGVSTVHNRDALQFVIQYLNSDLRMEAETAFILIAWATYRDHYDLIRPVVEQLRNTGLSEQTKRSAGFILGRIQDLAN